MWFLRPRSREDLERRMRAHKLVADFSFGLFGRAPDHTGSTLTGLAMNAGVFDQIGPGFAANILRHYEHTRRNDIFAAYAIVPPPGARDPEYHAKHGTDAGPARRRGARRRRRLSGMKLLATGAVYADEIWIGNAHPVGPSRAMETITCAVPCNAPGLSLWSRKPFAAELASPFDYPLASRFDESDAIVMCDRVFVPWERVFVHRDTEMTRHIYQQTPGQCLGNHQSNVRFWAKMGLMCGVLSRVASASGTENIPAVRDMLGRMASLEAMIGGLVHGQIHAYEDWPGGPEHYVCFNRRIMYAALNWCTESHGAIIEMLRELTGGSIFQMPADESVLGNDELRRTFELALVVAQRERARPHEALPPRLGPGRLGIRRPPPAIREILFRSRRRGARPQRPRGAVGPFPRHRRPRLRVARERAMMRVSYVMAPFAASLAWTIGPAAAAESAWEDVVKAALAEGEVDVHGGPGKLYEEALTQGFRAAYPAIKINFSGSSGRDAIPQIMREREAGVYHWDVYVGGTPSILQTLMPAGAFVPLRPALILPEVVDDKAWYGGLDGAWMDKARTYVLALESSVTPGMLVNWDFVSHDDLKTYQDLLKPQFADKIVWDDPRLPGQGVASGQRFLVNFGADFLKHLYSDQKIVYTSNTRQNAEWVVRGQYPIGIATAVEQVTPFQQQGIGKNIAALDAPLAHPSVSTGFGTVSMMDHAPIPTPPRSISTG